MTEVRQSYTGSTCAVQTLSKTVTVRATIIWFGSSVDWGIESSVDCRHTSLHVGDTFVSKVFGHTNNMPFVPLLRITTLPGALTV